MSPTGDGRGRHERQRGHPAAPATCRGPGGGSGLLGAATTPGRLLRVEAVLVVAALVLGVLGVLGGMARVSAVHDARTRIAALTTGAADLYQSLADADAMATTGYVSGGLEPATVRARYDDDIQRAGRLLTNAAGLLPPGDPAIAAVSTVGEQLPVYTGLVENARALNRLGLPLGQSYLASASKLMQSTILPAVEEVRAAESAALAVAYRQGAAIPFAVLAIGLAVLIAIADLALREWRRTNRVLNVGVTVAGLAVLASVAWWAVAAITTDVRIGGARAHTDAGAALDDARIAVLQARSNESLVLVARNSGGGSSDQAPSPPSWTTSSTTSACSPTPSAPIRSSPTGWPPCAAPPRPGAPPTATSAGSTTAASTRRPSPRSSATGRARPGPRSTRSTRPWPPPSARNGPRSRSTSRRRRVRWSRCRGSRRCWRWSRRAP